MDAQIKEAEKDIKRSYDVMAGLQTLDKKKYPFIDSLIEFHEERIRIYSDSIRRFNNE